MPGSHTNPHFAAAPIGAERERHPVVVVGAGLVGLTLALDLARRDVPVVVLDDDDTVSVGSRAICFAKRTLEIYGRLGLGAKFLETGVTWKTGRVFNGAREAYAFDLLPEEGHEYPAFVNLQQYYAEAWLVEACRQAGVVLRWRHRVTGVTTHDSGAALSVETPSGGYALECAWLLACDGARSTVREQMGLAFKGHIFHDHFLIADVRIDGAVPFPPERWFWFNPPFHPNRSVLLHKQPDHVWRIDFQLGPDADPHAAKQPENVIPRVRAMLGEAVPFELEWLSVYTFRCGRMDRFRHGRVMFVGDSAHQVSPFGARGGNGGVQDAENLAWKLALVLAGDAPDALLDSDEAERVPAADENILHSTRSTDFITPKSEAVRAYRDAVLELAASQAFARPLVNSGRLSRPASYADSPLNTTDGGWEAGALPGQPAPDAPIMVNGHSDWLLRHLGGGFRLLVFSAPDTVLSRSLPRGLTPLFITPEETRDALWDHAGLACARFDAPAGGAVLVRPDQHVAARFASIDPALVATALDRALGRTEMPA